MRMLLTIMAVAGFAVNSAGSSATPFGFHKRNHPINIGFNSAIQDFLSSSSSSSSSSLSTKKDLAAIRGGGKDCATDDSSRPLPGIVKWAYSAVGLGTMTAWTTIVLTTVRDNQPLGAMMPCPQHPLVNRISVLAAVPLIGSVYSSLRSAANSDTWEELSSESCRRRNLALVGCGVASALWVNFAPIITAVPGTELSHQAYKGAMKTALLSAYGSAAGLSALVWQQSLPEEVRNKPFAWPSRVLDGVSKSLVSLAPMDKNNPINVKYSALTSGFLVLTAIQTLGPHPLSAIPSWTGRRLARAFPVWTMLAAVTSYDLKEATENGAIADFRTLSKGIKAFGAVHLASKVGSVFFDPSFPESYHAIKMVPGWATAAIAFMTLTLRSDKVGDTLCEYVGDDIAFLKSHVGDDIAHLLGRGGESE